MTTPKEGIEVTQEAGFMCHIQMHAKLDAPCQVAYELIKDEDNARFFRNIDECTHRQVLHEDGRGRLRAEVDHESSWHFWKWGGSFVTSLLVEQDDNARVMAFRLRRPGFMKSFEGFWRMESFPGDPQATLAVLHQNVLPCVTAPGLNWILSKICRAQIEAMLEDVKQEVNRIQRGEPIPEAQLKKMEGKRSWKQQPVQGFAVDFSSDDDSPRASAAASPDANGSSRVAVSVRADDWELLKAAEHNMITPSPQQEDEKSEPPAVAIS